MSNDQAIAHRDNSGHNTQGISDLFQALRTGSGQEGARRALARAISLVEDAAPGAEDLLALCRGAIAGKPHPLRIGITGPAGAGKSTLVDALTRELRSQGKRVGIIAVDPSSPFSGGAILGDRIRLADFTADDNVYMRSLATRGHLGGLAAATEDVLTILEAAGFDALLIETTGVGQGEVEIAALADAVAVVLVPGMGDSIQSLKAGLLEIATVYVLNKADRAGIDQLESEIQEMLMLAAAISGVETTTPILKTTATTGAGVAELLTLMQAAPRGARQAIPLWADTRGNNPASKGPVLDHLGIAVRSIAASSPLYALLGAQSSPVETVEHERVRVQMISLGESRIELLEATTPDSVIGRFVEKRGEGLHHVALRVTDLAATVDRLRAGKIRLVSETIQTGAGGHRYVFLHPSSANGVLLELVEAGNPHPASHQETSHQGATAG